MAFWISNLAFVIKAALKKPKTAQNACIHVCICVYICTCVYIYAQYLHAEILLI